MTDRIGSTAIKQQARCVGLILIKVSSPDNSTETWKGLEPHVDTQNIIKMTENRDE
jgi:hypothetical protein